MSKSHLIVQPKGTRFSNLFHGMLERRGIVKRTRKPTTKFDYVKGRFSRSVLRNQVRRQLAYQPGTLGLSTVSEDIKDRYGVIISRSKRRQLAKVDRLANRRPKRHRRGR